MVPAESLADRSECMSSGRDRTYGIDIGAHQKPEGVLFRVWAPHVRQLAVQLSVGKDRRTIQLHPEGDGYFSGVADRAQAGDLYSYLLDGKVQRPDPASRFQPEGVHGRSQVVEPASYRWHDSEWRNHPLHDYLIYELHVGTFTREGTFAAIIPLLDHLTELGVTAVELMPVAQFPGNRNWGYDGVNLFAPHAGYGGPERLRELVDACHGRGLAVILDVVYNHLGPEGNYLREFGPYFTDHYRTPWGDAVNFDGAFSDEVRAFFIANALYWIREYHVDALRLDAVHGIFDMGARHFLADLNVAVRREAERLGRPVYLIAESDLNDARLISPSSEGGYGLHAQWCDDFHHALHALLTGEQDGYYSDFGEADHLVAALRDRYVYSGQFSQYRCRRHGNSAGGRECSQFVVFAQNHDQVGNRMLGERLSSLVSFESLKLAAALVLLSPYVPLLFMGEEYGETNPFLYFVSHEDPDLIAAVQAGRKDEFKEFTTKGEPPDPEAAATFSRSKLAWEKAGKGGHRVLLAWYKRLIHLRRTLPALSLGEGAGYEAACSPDGRLVWMRRHRGESEVICLFNVAVTDHEPVFPGEEGAWRKILDSADATWGGGGSALPESLQEGRIVMRGRSCAVYEKDASAV